MIRRFFWVASLVSMTVVTSTCSASTQADSPPKAAGQAESAQVVATDLQTVGKLMIGRWIGEVTFATDYPGVGKKGEKVTAYEACRWIIDGAAVECEGTAGIATWKWTLFWDAAARQVRSSSLDSGGNWSQGTFVVSPSKLEYNAAGSLADGRRVEYKGARTFEGNGAVQIESGVTIIGQERSPFRDTWKRVSR